MISKTVSIYWICSDGEAGKVPIIATSNEVFAKEKYAEIIDDLLSGCYEGEVFYLSGTDGYAWLDEDKKTVTLNNHQQDLMTIDVDTSWIEIAKNTGNFVWVVGLDEADEHYQTIEGADIKILHDLTYEKEVATSVSVCVTNNPEEFITNSSSGIL